MNYFPMRGIKFKKKEKGTGSGKGYDLISLVLSIAFKNNEDFACDWILFSFHVLNEQLIFSHFKSPVQEQ